MTTDTTPARYVLTVGADMYEAGYASWCMTRDEGEDTGMHHSDGCIEAPNMPTTKAEWMALVEAQQPEGARFLTAEPCGADWESGARFTWIK